MTMYIVFFFFLAGSMLGVIAIVNSSMRQRDVAEMKKLVSGSGDAAGQHSRDAALIKADEKQKKKELSEFVVGATLHQRLRDYIEQAGLDWDPSRTVYAIAILAVVGFNFFYYFVPRGEPIAVLGIIIGGGAPIFILYRKRAARLMAFEEQFPDALEYVARAMRTGHGFTAALEMLHREFGPPLSVEFKRAFDEQNLGLPLDSALERLAVRIPLLDVKFFVSAVLLQKRTGGNLAQLLDNLSYLIRERFKLRGKIRAISAHGRISGLVLALIPICTGLLMVVTNPDYVTFFFEDPDGRVMLALTVIFQVLGFVSVNHLTNLEV